MKSKLARITLVVGLLSTSIIGTFASPAKPARAAVAAPEAVWDTISLSKGGEWNGNGHILENSTGIDYIDCGPACTTDSLDVLPYINWPVYMTATASSDSAFTGWGGACSGTSPYCRLVMNDDKTVVANFTRLYTMTVAKNGNGAGTVTSTPSGINCGATCNSTFQSGTVVTLTNSPNTGSQFSGWSGACSGTGSCITTMTAAQNVTATFTLITYTVAVTKTGNGSGSISSVPAGISCGATCSTSYNYNTPITLTASADTGSTFTGWQGDCTANGSSCTTTVTGARNVTATFTLITYTVAVTKTGNGSGVITSTPGNIDCGATCSTSYNYNTPITLTASANTGSTFTGWEGNCTANGSSCTTTVTGTRNVTATFTLITYTVSVTKTGNGAGSITSEPSGIDCGETCSTSLDYNTPVTLTAAADTGSTFTGWEGDCTVDGLTCTTTVTGTRDVTATFTLITYTVTVARDGNGASYGSVTSDPGDIDCGITCSTSYDYNTPVTLTAEVITGATFSGWEGDCEANGLSCTTTVTGTRNVTATFTLITYTLSITRDGNGFGSITSDPGGVDCGISCTTNLDYNTPVTLTATPDADSLFDHWSGDCSADGQSCVTTITGTRDVTATFILVTHTVSITTAGNGSGSVTSDPGGVDCGETCEATFDHYTVVTLTASADTGSTFTGWEGDCEADGLSCTTTVTGTRNVTATFTLITYTLSVTKDGNGAGSIASVPSGIDCGATCSASFDYNTLVTLTASPDTGSVLTGWVGDCTANGLSCTTTVTGTRDVTATFTLITYTLSVTTTGAGSVTSDPSGIDCGATCSDDFDYNTVVTLTAAADTGHYFSGWQGDCAADGFSCTTTVTGTRNVTATFDVYTYTVSVAKDGNGTAYGSVTSDPGAIDCGITCSATFDYNTPVTLTAEVITGATFTGWQGNCSADGLACTTTVTGTRDVTATFTLITYTLSVSSTDNGSVTSVPDDIDCGTTCSATFDYNTVVTLTASPDTGYYLSGWQGDCTGNSLTCITTITGTRHVTATFDVLTYTVSVAKAGNGTAYGTVTSDPGAIDCGLTCSDSYDYNTPVTLTAEVITGATFTGWTGNCTANGLTCMTTVTGTRDVTATFTLITYTLSVSTSAHGSVTSNPSGIDCGITCSATFNYNTVVTLTASPDTGYYLSGWQGDCAGNSLTCTTTVTGTRNVTATFGVYTYTLRVYKDGASDGLVTSDPSGIDCGLTCTATYNYGTVVTLTQQPITGSAFGGWKGDCNGAGTCAVTILGNQSVTATFNLITTDLGVHQSVTRSLGTITFTVVITNGGPSGANGAIFSDTVTSEVGNPQWHCQAGNGASCPAADVSLSMVPGGVYSLYAALPSFPVGGVVTYTISGNVGLLAQRLTNVAQVIAPTRRDRRQ